MADFSLKTGIRSELWDACVEASRQGTIFLKSDFISSLKVRNQTYFVYQGQEPVCGCVVLESEKGEFLPSPFPFTPCQGFFFINGDTLNYKVHRKQFEITEFLMNALLERYQGLSQTHFRLDDIRPFSWHNYHTPEKGRFRIDVKYTSILDISRCDTLEAYLETIRTLRRREYRKAQAGGIEIADSKDIDLFIEVYAKTLGRQDIQVSPENLSLVRSITLGALEKRFGRLQFATVQGAPASAMLFLFDKKRGYYLFGANDPAYRASGAGTYLMLHNIWRCKEDGLSGVDFVGVNSPNRGDYKLSFNGELVSYFGTHFNVKPAKH